MSMASFIVTVSIALLTAVGYGLYVGYHHRRRIYRLRQQGMAMPEWSWITGHLLVLNKYLKTLPRDVSVNLAVRDLALEYGATEIFLLDMWPIYPAELVVYDPDAAIQITSKWNLPKTEKFAHAMTPITGGPSLIAMGGAEWKRWRALFNPGFSAASMTDLVPSIVDSAQVFCDKLRDRVGKGLFLLDDLTTRLTMDVILKVTLDADLDYQRSDNPLATALNKVTTWHSFWDPRILAHPLRPFIQRYYGSVMDRYIRTELDKRFSEAHDNNSTKRGKSVISLALEAYRTSNDGDHDPNHLDESFARYATHQIRLFLFAGNDTTSSTIVYIYHLLSQHPAILARLRSEHDTIFGTDPNPAELLRARPALLNDCTYTTAVIKETLRLYPPAATLRQGASNHTFTDRHGTLYPTDGLATLVLHPASHANPRVWPRPTEFLPERFLVPESHALHPVPGAYRPFEHGPRACIGQTLVFREIQAVLALTVREFDVKPAYEEWDAMRAGWGGEGVKTVWGDRAYQTDRAGTHPADGYPCRVVARELKREE
ncbi:putative cytochrome P450 [Aspergillus campestris IBT 28561]|uniref:Cytochrome P450 n=1 Tax=Aspergillus campestris (strain IBT 28561) TaxID=1392248 RepID=A0A2I1CRZ2_ASPC2|nr:putative cytochrome P450 [Aspergillus campestris IBT 28561]PKY00379.1 putative cytochrome P450 [Aspergillus campestris IBT 28561]